MEIKDRDIIITGQQPWDVEIGSNCKNIALEFSKNNRVLYVNSPLDRFNRLKNKNDPKIKKRIDVIKGKEKSLVEVKSNLWNLYPDKISESVSFIKNYTLFNFFNQINNKRFAASIQIAMKQLGFKNVILFNDNDIYRSFYLKDLLKPTTSIYYSRDFMLAVEYWKRHGQILEPLLIKKSNLCVANSTYLADYCRQYNPQSFYVGQGCDLEIFSQADYNLPDDMIPIKDKPVIGYVGALQTLRLDLNIIEHIAMHRPNYNIVLVGPEDDGFKRSPLHNLKNVFFLGSKTPDELPRYIHAFNVCLNPQVVNQVTIGNYPRKIDEYLAMGKPVVATLTTAMGIFSAYTYLANDKEGYVTLIDTALKEDNKTLQESRKQFAATHTWENSVAEIYKAVQEIELINKK